MANKCEFVCELIMLYCIGCVGVKAVGDSEEEEREIVIRILFPGYLASRFLIIL